jgi:hypothetical protein
MATYVNDLRLKEIGTGESSGTWGTESNVNLELIASAMGYGSEAIANASTHTITMADGAADEFRCTFLRLTGGGQACTVTLAPNTLSHTWIIRNTTSYALTLTQGSGANVIIAAGQAKMVTTDGAGSGAVVYECLEDLELGGTLTVGIDDTGQDVKFFGATSGKYWLWDESADGVVQQGTLTVGVDDTGYDVKFFGATSGAYMLWDESADDLKLVGAAGLTVAGDIDVDGTANLDVVDIDGAVDMASTLGVSGVVTANAGVVVDELTIDGDTITATDDFTIDAADDILLDADGGDVVLLDGGAQYGKLTSNGSNLIIKSGATTAITFANAAATFASTVGVTGAVTANAGVVVDNITIDGTEIDLSSGSLTIDVASDIFLDADGGTIRFKDGGTTIADFTNDSSDLLIQAKVQDKDIKFVGDDGGSSVTALLLDMSEAGAATFNDSVTADTLIGGASNFDIRQNTSDGSDNQRTRIGGGGDVSQSRGAFIELTGNEHSDTGDLTLNAGDVSGGDIIFKTDNTSRVVIEDGGFVGIGDTDPDKLLCLKGDGAELVIDDTDSTDTPKIRFRESGSTSGTIHTDSSNLIFSTGSTEAFRLNSSQNGTFAGDCHITGALTKGSGTFRIPHGLRENYDLCHSFVEGPQCDLIYRGRVDLVDGRATVSMDTKYGMTAGTFEWLTKADDIQTFTSNETGWDAVKSSFSGDTITIECQNSSSTDTISWMVVAERGDPNIKASDITDANGNFLIERVSEPEPPGS